MGALIMTPGTVQLIKLLNGEFDVAGMVFYRNAGTVISQNSDGNNPFANKIAKDVFDFTIEKYRISQIVRNVIFKKTGEPAAKQRFQLGNGTSRIAIRWSYYVDNILCESASDAIRDAISLAINDVSYSKIIFDCIEDTELKQGEQKVYVAKESNYDPSGLPTGQAWMKIVLVTPAMLGAPASP